jgi:protein-disulfide isomerase
VRRANLFAVALAIGSTACGASDAGGTFETRLAAIAGQAGLDVAAWQACRSDPAMDARVSTDLSLGRATGIRATPSFLVNGARIEGAEAASVFRAAIDAARARAQASGVPAAQYYDLTFPTVPVGSSPMSGPADAWVTIVEFSDFECPWCARAQPTLAAVLPEYGSDVRLVFKHYGFHSYSRTTAIAAECAHAQGRFWPFHDLVFGGQSALFDGL